MSIVERALQKAQQAAKAVPAAEPWPTEAARTAAPSSAATRPTPAATDRDSDLRAAATTRHSRRAT